MINAREKHHVYFGLRASKIKIDKTGKLRGAAGAGIKLTKVKYGRLAFICE
jgi:hypothetical protein